MPCHKGENCDGGSSVSVKTGLVVLVLVGVLVGAYFLVILPASAPPMSVTLFVRDAAGNKHTLTRSFLINGIEATSIGVDYSFSVSGEPTKVTIHIELWDVGAGHTVICPTGGVVETTLNVPMTGDTSGSGGIFKGPYTGSVEWTCTTAFAHSDYYDGASHTIMFKGTAQAYGSTGSAVGAQLSAGSLSFTLKYERGGLTDFSIYV